MLLTVVPMAAMAADAVKLPGEIALDTGGVVGGHAAEDWITVRGERSVRNVVRATLTPVLPAPDSATGLGVVIAPGGAFRALSMDLEGLIVARWLADHGIAAFVLKYRLVPTSPAWADFGREMAPVMKAAIATPANPAHLPAPDFAIEDGAAALRLVRAQAARFGVDPKRVGMMGFSAGAITALGVASVATPETMPAFIAPIYPAMTAVAPPAPLPPMFVALAADDPLFARGGFAVIRQWVDARGKVEFHLYQRGGHGFGSGKPGTTSAGWLDQFLRWLDLNKLLKPAG